MSAGAERVDVLAIIADAATWVGPNEKDQLAALAAVRELIEADREFDAAALAYGTQWTIAGADGLGARMVKAVHRRRAALARVQGGDS